MITITLPDGSKREFAAAGHGGRGGRVDRRRPGQGGAGRQGRRQGWSTRATASTPTRSWPSSPTRTPTAWRCIRHSTAHLLAYAVKELFPDAQVTIGPVIENGFYYDFAYKRPFTPEDLAAIESEDGRAGEARTSRCVRRVLPRDEAVAYFKGLGEHYKAEIIASIPADEDVSLYREGALRGPVPRPARAQHRQAQALQADEGGRRLLARRPRATRCCSASTARPGRRKDELKQYLHDAGGGREARPPQARPRARPVPPATSSAGHGVLAPQGLDGLAAGRAVHARASTATTATRRSRARRSWTARCGRRPATGTSTARTCSRRSRRSATTRSSR